MKWQPRICVPGWAFLVIGGSIALSVGAQTPAQNGLTKAESVAEVERAWAGVREQRSESLKKEVVTQEIQLGEQKLKLLERRFGKPGKKGWPLFISLHGGGGAPAKVNDGQWRNQIRLYEPKEGIVVAPRAPGNTWDLWHRRGVDELLDRLIDAYVATQKVDPDQVHLLGYSAGGDGVYQLGPRFGDRLASAAMMAGHPNEARPDGLRNLPFQIFMGAEDTAFKRNEKAKEWGDLLRRLREQDAEGYLHRVRIYEGLGHWMKRRDAECLPWMLKRIRVAWPKRVVWQQDNVLRRRFAWLARPAKTMRAREKIVAWVEGQHITIETEVEGPIDLRLSDSLVDLDRAIKVTRSGRIAYEGLVPRMRDAITRSFEERLDPATVATAELRIER